jgi:hypothetical protein
VGTPTTEEGRWHVVDPVADKPHNINLSAYVYVANNPMTFVDPEGADRIEYIRTIGKDGTVLLNTQVTKGYDHTKWNSTYTGVGYATKNNFAVYTTNDYRGDKLVVTSRTETLYGSGNATEIGFWDYVRISLQGEDGKILPQLPQLMVFGSNSEDPGFGSKADPNRPITVIDMAAYNALMSLVMVGMKIPDLKGADPSKIPDIVDKWRKEEIRKSEKVLDCQGCDQFKKNGFPFDTTGKGLKPWDFKSVSPNDFH